MQNSQINFNLGKANKAEYSKTKIP